MSLPFTAMAGNRRLPPHDTYWQGTLVPLHLNPDTGDCYFAWTDIVGAVSQELVDAMLAKWDKENGMPMASLQRDGPTMVHIQSYEVRRLTSEWIAGGRVTLPILQARR